MSLKSFSTPNTLEINYIISKRIQKHLDGFCSLFTTKEWGSKNLEFKYISYDKEDESSPEIIVDADTIKDLKSINRLIANNDDLMKKLTKILNIKTKQGTMSISVLENYIDCLQKIKWNLELILQTIDRVYDKHPRENDLGYNKHFQGMKNEIIFLNSSVVTELSFIEKSKEHIKDSVFDYSVFNTKYGFIDGKINSNKLKEELENKKN